MKEAIVRVMPRPAAMLGVALALAASALVAQAGPPGLSTNPGNHVIYPAKGQSPEQPTQGELRGQQLSWEASVS